MRNRKLLLIALLLFATSCARAKVESDPNMTRRGFLAAALATGALCVLRQFPTLGNTQNSKDADQTQPKNCIPASTNRKFYNRRPAGPTLPTGCPVGMGPQYQSFGSELGKIVRSNSQADSAQVPEIEAYTVSICLQTQSICRGAVSGPSCCANACRQMAAPPDVANTSSEASSMQRAALWRAAYASPGYLNCIAHCPGIPHPANHLARAGLETQMRVENLRK